MDFNKSIFSTMLAVINDYKVVDFSAILRFKMYQLYLSLHSSDYKANSFLRGIYKFFFPNSELFRMSRVEYRGMMYFD